MPLSLLLELTSASRAWEERPGALRALGYALIGSGDPALAQALHDGPGGGGERPFTIAVLPTSTPENGGPTLVRVAALGAPTGDALLAGAARLLACDGGLTFGRESVTLVGCHLDQPPLAEGRDYGALAQVTFAPHVALRFVTPTAFSQGGERHLPLPVPDLLLRGWARRWNRWAPPEMECSDEVVSGVIERTGLAYAQIETVTVSLRPGKIIGFVGDITLEALRPAAWPEGQRRAFAALCAFSRFCGSGARTTQGLGLTLPGDGGRHGEAPADYRL